MTIGFIIRMITFCVMIAFCVTAFVIIFRLLKGASAGAEKSFANMVDNNYKKRGNIGKQKLKMSRLGIMYRLNDYNMSPSKYEIVRIFVGIMFVLILYLAEVGIVCLAGLPVGYIATDLLFRYLNKRDNEAMSLDIYNTYATLKIQLTSGVYIADCLEYTYKIVQHERYKQALKELVINFADKTITSTEAIEIFKNRFQSKDIDKLCGMMEMFVQYGVSENYLQDIMYEIQSILSADALRNEHMIEQKVGFITFGFFVMVIAMVFVSMIPMFQGITLF